MNKIKDVMEEHTNWLVNPYTPIAKERLELIHIRIGERDTNLYVESLIDYIENILKESYEYGTLLLAIQLLTDVLENINYEQAKILDDRVFNLLMLLKYRLGVERVASMLSDETHILQSCESYFQNFYVRYLDKMKRLRVGEPKEYEFLMKIMVETDDVDAIKKILTKRAEYVKMIDEYGRSLFYVVVQKYMTTKEEKYLRFLAIILESPNFSYDGNEVRSIYDTIHKLLNTKLKDKYVVLLRLLDHYFKIDGNRVEFYNSFSAVGDKVVHEEYKEEIGRVDITSLRTIGLTSYGENSTYGIDNIYTYSIDITRKGFDIYYHFPDIDVVMKRGSKEDRRAGHLFESVYHSKRALFLFDTATLDKVKFEPGNTCEAITFRIRVSKKGQVQELSVFPSLISLDKVYDNRRISGIKDIDNHPDIGVYDSISKLFRKDGESYTSVSKIVDPLSQLLESCVYCLGEGNIPFIYRNVLSGENMEQYLKRKTTLQIIEDSWNSEGRRFFKNTIKHKREEVVVYSTELLKCPLKEVRSVPIISPEMDYVALENIRLIRDFIGRRFGSQTVIYSVGLLKRSSKIMRSGYVNTEIMDGDESYIISSKSSVVGSMNDQKQRLFAESIIASIVDGSHYRDSAEVKRLLHNM